MKMKKYFLLVVVILTTLLVTACGRNNNNNDNETQDPTGNVVGVGSNQVDLEVETLTIFANMWSESRLRDSTRSFSEYMALQGRIVEVNLMTYMQDESDIYMEKLLGQLDTGIGPDIVSRDNAFLYRLIENGFLLDFNEIISRYGNPDDFLMNILEHTQVNGRSYIMPTDINLQFIGINENIPQRFINRFEALEVVTMLDIIEIYLELIEEFPEFAEFSLMHGVDFSQTLLNEVSSMVDFTNRTANLAGLYDFMENLGRVFENDMSSQSFWGMETDELMADRAENYIFMSTSSIESALFEFQNPYFVHYRPLANNDGNLLANWPTSEFSITTNANVELAWAFIEHTISQMFTTQNWSMRLPFARRYLHSSVEETLGMSMQFRNESQRPLAGSPESMVDIVIRRLERYSLLPITIPQNRYLIPWNAFGSDVFGFFNPMPNEAGAETISITELLQSMEDSLIAWMNEEREIIPYVPAAPVEDLGLPAQVLTIRGSRNFTLIAEQAAAAMNAVWREQDKPYVFAIEFDYFDPHDWEGMEARDARFRTDLMAGSAPDLLFLEPRNMQNVFDFTRSGFFADFYELIDNSPRFSRDDFFTNVLDEFEMLGMLPILPLGFSFNYLGVNASLPQEFTDQFGNLPYLSRMQLINMYLAFRERYTEFYNLDSGLPWTITDFWQLFYSNASNFINLATRTSYLNSPEFIEMIIELYEMFKDDPFGGGSGRFISMPIANFDTLQEVARQFMFMSYEFALNPAHAFITADESPFIHGAPLTDEMGRLIIDLEGGWNNNSWADVAITNGNNVDLAWEFVYHLINAFANPEGRAAVMPGMGFQAPWGMGAVVTPILRDLAQTHVRRTFEYVLGNYASAFDFTQEDEPNFPRLAEEAAVRFLAYSERPVSLSANLFPIDMLHEHLIEFMQGIISAEVAAQRMHNMMSLWLIE